MASSHEPEHKLELRNLRISDYDDIREILDLIYTKSAMGYTRNELKRQIQKFPEGQIGIEDNGKIVAAALSIIVDYSKFGDRHTYKPPAPACAKPRSGIDPDCCRNAPSDRSIRAAEGR